MMVHHAATLSVLLCAWRFGFARVGVAVVSLHDASDIPIDLIRIAQAIEWEGLLYVGAATSVISWAVLRAYAFPRYIISSAIFATGHIWPTYSFVPDFYIYCGYTIYIAPLVLLWLLSCYWLTQLSQKLIQTIRRTTSPAPQATLGDNTRPGSNEVGRGASRRSGTTIATRLGVAVALLAAAVRGAWVLIARGPGDPSLPPQQRMRFAVDSLSALHTPHCLYYNLSTVWDVPVLEHLHPYVPTDCDPYSLCDADAFDGAVWSRWTSQNWQLPLLTTPVYLLAIVLIQKVMASQPSHKLQLVVAPWNFGLSLFSMAGVYYCVPQLLFDPDGGLLTRGFYASVCMHASSYGCGRVGMFVALFVYSKFAELLDTLWLLLRKSPVILLHWYHHASVLLYCWHSYSARIGTGLWFASMNYLVHSIMYFYFGLTQLGPRGRRLAKKFSIFITLLQLTQMVVGIAVTVASVGYHARGARCYVSMANSFLGLLMYASYFGLFAKLFYDHYVIKGKDKALAKQEPAARSAGVRPTVDFEAWSVGKGEVAVFLEEASTTGYLLAEMMREG